MACEEDQIVEKKQAIVVGPWGGHGGDAWDDGTFNGIREITLKYGACIDSICVVYDKHGKPFHAPKHGGTGGSYTAKIELRWPVEFLTSVSGYVNLYNGIGPVIRSLTFKSNLRTFGPYGVEEGNPFSFPMKEGKIVGLKGRSGWYLDAIAFRVTPVHISKPLKDPILDNVHKHIVHVHGGC